MKITCYKSLFNPKAGDFVIPVEKAFSRIKNGSSKTLLEKIRAQRIEAMKARRAVEKDILSVVMGDAQTLESNQGSLEDKQVIKIIKKIVKNNHEALGYKPSERLEQENQVLEGLLPQEWSKEQIREALENSEVLNLKEGNTGEAIGAAVNYFKNVEGDQGGKEISEVVREIRNGN